MRASTRCFSLLFLFIALQQGLLGQTVVPYLKTIPQPTDLIYCSGSTVEFRIDSLAATAQYQWSTGATTNSISLVLSQDTLVEVTVTQPGNITTLVSPQIRVAPELQLMVGDSAICPAHPSNAIFVEAVSGNLCAGCSVSLINNPPAASPLTVFTGSNLPFSRNSGRSGSYYAQVDGSCKRKSNIEFVDTANFNLQLISAPGDSVCAGTAVDLVATSACSGCSYTWSTGATVTNRITITQPGTYGLSMAWPNNSLCQVTASRTIVASTPQFDTLVLLPVSIGTQNIPLDSIIDYALPNTVLNNPLEFIGAGIQGSVGLGFTFTPPSSALNTLHPIVARSYQGACFEEITVFIPVIPNPDFTGLSQQYCLASPPAQWQRDPNYNYSETTVGTRIIRNNVMQVSAQHYNGTLVPLGSANPQLQYYEIDPSQIDAGTGYAILSLRYRSFIEDYDNLGNPLSSRSYSVGFAEDTVFRVATINAQINNSNPVFCKENAFRQINVSPGGGTMVIRRLNGLRSGFDTSYAVSSAGELFFNPFLLHDNESTDIDFRLTYTVGSGVCAISVSTDIMIPVEAQADFATQRSSNPALRRREYCLGDAPDPLNPVASVNGVFTINGSLSNPPVFTPSTVGQFLVAFNATNSSGCSNTRVDTFIVNPLPSLSFATALAPSRCIYDSVMTVTGQPAGGQLILSSRLAGTSTVGNGYVLDPAAILQQSIESDTAFFSYGYTDASTGCTDTISERVFLHPRPVLSMTALASIYCQNSPSIELDPRPTGTGGALDVFGIGGGTATSNLQQTQQRYTPALETQGTGEEVVYSYTNPQTLCSDTLRDTVRVLALPASQAQFNAPMPLEVCLNGDTILVLGAPNNAAPAANFSSFSCNMPDVLIHQAKGSATVEDSAFLYPPLGQTGPLILYYSFEGNGCSQTIADTMQIRPLPELDFRFLVPLAIRSNIYPTRQDTFCYSLTDSVLIEIRDLNSQFPNSPISSANPNLEIFGDKVDYNRFFFPDSAGLNIIQARYSNDFTCQSDSLAVVNVLPNPEPIISGLNALYCTGANTDTVLGVPSNGTWSLFDGITSYPATGNTINSAQARVEVAPSFALLEVLSPGALTLRYQYTNASTGCTNRSSQNFSITAPPTINLRLRRDSTSLLDITNGGTVLCENSPPIGMEAYADGQYIARIDGLFEDTTVFAGIINDTAFVPSAQTGLRILRYSFTDPSSGCLGELTSSVFIEDAPGANLIGLDTAYCVDNAPVALTEASTGVSVQGMIYPLDTNQNLNLLAPAPNGSLRYELDPAAFGVGIHLLEVAAESGSGCRDTAQFPFLVRGLPTGVAIDNRNPLLCSNEALRRIDAFPPLIAGAAGRFWLYNLATGNIVDSSQSSSTIFNLEPALYSQTSGLGEYQLVFEYSDPNSCSSYDSSLFRLHASPEAAFVQQGFCFGDSIHLQSQSTVSQALFPSDTINQWIWSYQGRSFSNTSSPRRSLLEENMGWGLAQLIVATAAGCRDTIRSGQGTDTVFVFNKPQVAFESIGGCVGDSLSFEPLPTQLIDSISGVAFDNISSWTWSFDDGTVQNNQNPNTTSLVEVPALRYLYQVPGVYYVELRVENRGYCGVEDSLRIVISPTQAVGETLPAYSEDFEIDHGDWYQSDEDSAAIWTWGTATGSWLNTPNNKVWSLRDSTAQGYPAGRISSIYGPCIDFSDAFRPMIKLDITRDMFSFDGVVLEYYDEDINPDNGNPYGWRSLGDKDMGLSWYNSQTGVFGILPLKRANLRFDHLNAWTGRFIGKISARYRLDHLRGRRNVRFRLSLGSLQGATCVGSNCPQGFAFDNIWVGERRRIALVEYFTNLFRPDIIQENQSLYNQLFTQRNAADVTLLQYHTQKEGSDVINALNIPDHNSRAFYYGSDDAKVVVDGKVLDSGSYDSLSQWNLDSIMLQDPVFDIQVAPLQLNATGNNGIILRSRVKALENLPRRNYVIYAVIAQDSVTTIDGIHNHAVMRKIVPGHGLLEYNRSFSSQDSIVLEELWEPDSRNWAELSLDTGKLYAVVFVQDDSTKEVYQVASSRDIDFFNLPTSLEPQVREEAEQQAKAFFALRLYPNPANTWFRVEWEQPLQERSRYALRNALGQELLDGYIEAGQQQLDIQNSSIPSGIYFLDIQQDRSGHRLQRQLVIVRD